MSDGLLFSYHECSLLARIIGRVTRYIAYTEQGEEIMEL